MRGYIDFNFPAFFAAADKLRTEGHTVFNPAEEDLKTFGSMEEINSFFSKHTDTMKRIVIRKDLDYIIDYAEAIAMLPGWEASPGANAELALAKFLKLKEIYL